MVSGLQYRPPQTRQRPLLEERRPPGVYIAVEGPIGVGKTTLVRRLAGRLDAAEVLEVVEDNPFLRHFYGDIRGYAFQTQLFFLLSRYRQQESIRAWREAGRSVVSDYLFAKDRLFARMNLEEHELDLYEQLYALLAPTTVPPDLVIYLTASLETLRQRILQRDRSFERAIPPAYLDRLCQEYERFFAEVGDTALLRVDTDQVNIFAEEALQEIARYAVERTPP
ncbi:MAG: deoxynucleoside kinase [Armatimonadota bacterium]|nr:deoxynucleoside kinase [Armatimonadota bacterium]MDR7451616.1 deoxynucleoside kinase [Armatimonadota bacterium]MDR7467664.1 deoxynucleoside kinase [Armatimonadota bacterium]MDR7492585.1 deoxynucleoside kinase [Armatimonadota bacterium]MDR7499947.1 deoxynucleoside kinase [Armatimonadota bacterium]